MNNSLQLNNNYTQQNNQNNTILPSFDFYTDIKILTNSNESYFNQSNSNLNPYGLSKLSMDKYNEMKSTNLENKEKSDKSNKNKLISNNKQNKVEEEINEENSDNERKNKNLNDIKKYKKINIVKSSHINKKNEKDVKKSNEDIDIDNINNNLRVSSILNDTIGDNFRNTNKNNSQMDKNEDLIAFLKKENEDLKESNEKNIQLINSLFYFINQLSQKYSPDKNVFELSYYDSNIGSLSSDLNNLNDFIQKQNEKSIQNQNEKSIQNKNYNNNIINNNTSIKIDSIKNEEKDTIKNKNKAIKKSEHNKRKKNDNIDLGRTFTFGRNDSFNKNSIGNKINKKQDNNKTMDKEKYQFKKINHNRSKNKNEINLLGCNVQGSNSRSKNNSKINLKDKNFNCIPNENDAFTSLKKIIYE